MKMKEKIAVIRTAFAEKKEKAADLEEIVREVMALPYGQLKKVLTPAVLEILEKYGCGEVA